MININIRNYDNIGLHWFFRKLANYSESNDRHSYYFLDIFTVKVSFLARDRERTVSMYFPDIYQNEKLNRKKFTLTKESSTVYNNIIK
jgi:hypothetical protein